MAVVTGGSGDIGRACTERAQMDLDTFDRIQHTNVRGTFVVDQFAGAHDITPLATTHHVNYFERWTYDGDAAHAVLPLERI
ncbi:hypothetical protein ACFXKG_39495 [Streptomyces sp. NPDC059255]|uniref:hypothetical protein n=1 Tax=Streptomyces sp. NPDC059255 TaxID=3346793 RepID=UPI0036BAA443